VLRFAFRHIVRIVLCVHFANVGREAVRTDDESPILAHALRPPAANELGCRLEGTVSLLNCCGHIAIEVSEKFFRALRTNALCGGGDN
jgi:hypothetical protein